MDDSSTREKKKQVSTKLWELYYIVQSLERAGVDIINAQAGDRSYVLIHCRSGHADFRRWAAAEKCDITVEPAMVTDPDYGLRWKIGTSIDGIDVHGWMTNQDKEEYDAAV